MRTFISLLGMILILGFMNPALEAKPKKKPLQAKKSSAVASKQTKAGIEKLMGIYQWGMSPQKVLTFLEKDIHAEMDPAIKSAATDPIAQDRLRKELNDKLKELKESHIKFMGTQTPWDISMIDKEFAHRNHESLIVIWTKDDRRFFFFHNDKLWKIYIAFNTDLFKGKTFEDFTAVMEARFGSAERKFSPTISGDMKMDRLAWPPSGKTLLQALDNTQLYSNFCLVLIDKNELEIVNAGRKINSPRKEYSDPLVDSVVKGQGMGADENEDIIDRITGRGMGAPPVNDGPSSSGRAIQSPTSGKNNAANSHTDKRNNKKNIPKNALEGLDL